MSDKETPWGKLAGMAGAVVVIAGLAFWGVPHYIKVQVRAQVTTELTAYGVDEIETVADTNAATGTAILLRLDNMETRMVERDAMFIAYLERQAELARERGQ